MAWGQSISGREKSGCRGPESESCSAPHSISKEAGGLSEVNVGVGREVGGEALGKIAQGPVDH